MALAEYFQRLIDRVEKSDIGNNGKDENGFFKPTRTLLLRHLQMLRDLHDKPRARTMLKGAWTQVVQDLPPEWLVLSKEEKAELKAILSE